MFRQKRPPTSLQTRGRNRGETMTRANDETEEEDDRAAALGLREENEEDEDVNEAARNNEVKTNEPRR